MEKSQLTDFFKAGFGEDLDQSNGTTLRYEGVYSKSLKYIQMLTSLN